MNKVCLKPCTPSSAQSTNVANDFDTGPQGMHVDQFGLQGKHSRHCSDQWSRGLRLFRQCYQVPRNSTPMRNAMTGIPNCPPSLTIRETLILSQIPSHPSLKHFPCYSVTGVAPCTYVAVNLRCCCC